MKYVGNQVVVEWGFFSSYTTIYGVVHNMYSRLEQKWSKAYFIFLVAT